MAVFLSFDPVMQEDDTMPDDVHLIKEVQALRARRLLRTLAVVQMPSWLSMTSQVVTLSHSCCKIALELQRQQSSSTNALAYCKQTTMRIT